MKNNIKVSVCIPVYKVEKYIARCVRSLMEQTLSGLELIFVNDATPDNSIQVLEETLKEYHRDDVVVKIIHHEKNMGVAQTRMDAMKTVSGEYFIHCDPDDYVEPEMYQNMYQKAIQTDADLVYSDFRYEFHILNQKDRLQKRGCLAVESIFELKQKILTGIDFGTLWNKMYRGSLLNNLEYPENTNYGEDVCLNIALLNKCKKIQFIDSAFYHYTVRENSLCTKYSDNHLNDRISNAIFLKQCIDEIPLKRILWHNYYILIWECFCTAHKGVFRLLSALNTTDRLQLFFHNEKSLLYRRKIFVKISVLSRIFFFLAFRTIHKQKVKS